MPKKYDETPPPDIHYGRPDTPAPELIHPSAKTAKGRAQLRKQGVKVGPPAGDLVGETIDGGD